MAEEQFFSMFMDKLTKEVEGLPRLDLSATFTQRIYPKYWNKNENCEKPDFPIIACDGSLGSSHFSGGITFWVARAVAHTYFDDALVRITPLVDVKADYRLEGQSFFMKAVELKALRLAIEEALKEYENVFAIYDGSFYLVFLHYQPHIKARKEEIEVYVSELHSLLRLGMKNNVKLLGVSKDSNISYLRAHIIVKELLGHKVEGLSYYRSISRMRDKMSKDMKHRLEADQLKEYLREIESDISDEALINSLMNEPGFTTPLLLAPQTCYVIHEAKKGYKHWSESNLRNRSHESLVPLLDKMDELYGLPPIAITYWKPKHGIRTYRLDIPSYLLGYDGKCENLTRDQFADSETINAMKELIGTLNWLDKKAYGIRPLVDVDEIARLAHRRYRRAYEPVILEELRTHGFEVEQRKRSMRDYFMRRY